MRFLILGGFGYIGSRLTRYLQENGHQVVVGTRRKDSEWPIWSPGFEVVKLDWTSTDSLKKACCNVDVVIHTAGMDSSASAINPTVAIAFKRQGAARLITAANDANVKRVIYLSTIHVYGSPLEGNISESTVARNTHPYTLGHLVGESAVLKNLSDHSTAATVLRLSNVFGLPMHHECNGWSLVLNDVCKQATLAGHVRLSSDGTSLRDFVPINSVCKTILAVATAPHERVASQLFNVGTGVTRSVAEMVTKIGERFLLKYGKQMTWEARREPNNNNQIIPFVYSVDKIKSLVKMSDTDGDVEIDRLLTGSLE